MNKNRALSGLLLGILSLLVAAGDVAASAFTVTPVRVLLGRGGNSALLSVKNDSTEPIRFQITLKAWNQNPAGEMELSDTSDLVFFPSFMELKAGEQRNVRVGSAFKAPVTTERSYRIFFEELPPPQVARSSESKTTAAEVRVLTKMGVPIFVQPATPVLKGELTNMKFAGRGVDFDVLNSGNSFFTVTSAKISGLSKEGTATFDKTQDGWYILAGGVRHFRFEIPADKCAATDHLKIDVSTTLNDPKGNPTLLTQAVTVPPGSCEAARKTP